MGGEGRREWNGAGGPGTLSEGGLYLNICAGVPRVPIYANVLRTEITD